MQIDRLKATMTAKGGNAQAHQFAVTLPGIAGISSDELNILASAVTIPGRQIMTQERLIGIKGQRMPTGFAADDVTMRFIVLNDYGVRKYFEAWQNKVVNQDNYEIGYVNSYAENVKIYQLKKGVSFPLYNREIFRSKAPSNLTNRLPSFGGIDLAQGEIDIDILWKQQQIIYAVELQKAFPTTLSALDLSNEAEGLLQLTVQMSYKNWKQIER